MYIQSLLAVPTASPATQLGIRNNERKKELATIERIGREGGWTENREQYGSQY